MFNRLFWLICVLASTSCISLSNIEIQVLEPASEPFLPAAGSVILLNRSVAAETESHDIDDHGLYGMSRELFNSASTEIIFALADILDESPGTDINDGSRLLEIVSEYDPEPPSALEAAYATHLCDSLGVNAIISLEYVNIEIPDKIILTKAGVDNYYGIYYIGEIVLPINTLWRIYDHETGNIKDEYFWRDTMSWQHASYIASEIPDFLPSPEKAALNAAYFTALNYARRIAPYWVIEGRSYFSRGNRTLRRASRSLISGRFDQAQLYYESLLDNLNENIVAAAYFNLALLQELKGDYRQSVSLARRSYHKLRHPLTSDYIDILEERLKKSAELDLQMGRN